MSTRTRGRLIALTLFVIVAGVLGFSMFTAKEEPSEADGRGPDIGVLPLPVPTDATSITDAHSVHDLISTGNRGVWTHTDESGRVTMRLLGEKLDPREGGRFELSGPESWMYAKDGTRVRIGASHGDFLWPRQDKEPESAALTAVEGAIFGPAKPGESEDEPGEPIWKWSIDTLRADSSLSQLESTDRLVVEGDRIKLEVEGFLIRLSETERSLRYLRVDPHPENRLTIRPGQSTKDAKESAPEGETSTVSDAEPGAPLDEIGEEAFYELTLNGPVTMTMGEGTVLADRLTLLVRFVGGKLRDTAIASIDFQTPKTGVRSKRVGAGSGRSQPDANEQSPMVVSWLGSAEIRLLADEPIELGREDVFVRLDASDREPVTYTDAALGYSVRGGRFTYGATTRTAVLDVQGPATNVALGLPDGGMAEGRRLELDLSRLPIITGVMSGPARLIAAIEGDDAKTQSSVEWSGAGQFTLKSNEVGVSPLEVILNDRVVALGSNATAKGQQLRALFREATSADTESGLASLLLSGSATLIAENGVELSADEASVLFERVDGSKDPEPVFASANGRVKAKADGAEIRSADRIAAKLSRDKDDRLIATVFEATGGVAIGTREGVEIHGEHVTADVQKEIIDVTGTPATIMRSNSTPSEVAGITGGSLRIDGVNRRLLVFGPGTATRTASNGGAASTDRISVEWSEEMTYDDVTGLAECRGDVAGTGELRGTDRHVLRGDHLLLVLTAAPSETEQRAQRELLSATMSGSAFDPAGHGHARAEFRRYLNAEPQSGGVPTLEGLLAIESQAINVRALDRLADAPGPGRLVIEDRHTPSGRADREASPKASDVLVIGAPTDRPNERPTGTRGTSVFTWDGGVRVDGYAGRATMRNNVRVRHKPVASKDVVELECEQLTANFEPLDQSTAPASEVQLREISASGAVFVRRGLLQVVCDRVRYNVSTNTLIAEAEDGNRITIDDAERGSSVSAEAVEIDTNTGRWTQIKRGSATLGR